MAIAIVELAAAGFASHHQEIGQEITAMFKKTEISAPKVLYFVLGMGLGSLISHPVCA